MADIIEVKVEKKTGLKIVAQNYVPPAKSSGPARDIDNFLGLVDAALETYQDRLGIPKEKRLIARAAWPKDPVDKPGKDLHLVSFKVIERKNANMSPDRERRPFKAQQKETAQHPDDPTLMIVTKSQLKDNIVECRVQSADLSEADNWALFFERFMMAFEFYFRDMGIQFIKFEERREDTIEIIGGMEVYIRPIRYLIRTEIVSQSVAKKIDQIDVEYDVGRGITTNTIDKVNGISEHSVYRRS